MHKLEEIRMKLQINKTEMARRLGITKSNYSNIINGHQGISVRVALKAYQEFGVPLEELLCPGVQRCRTSDKTAP
ncbi:helix-turn-helix domain-containing protein [Desulfovirgula thermocuniculi]|uniref:helix-turn-helix domain-containing protein n=1 Tax=Desulfovirgula thermocuniculi TaxID=348842 RepID=UPI000A0243CA